MPGEKKVMLSLPEGWKVQILSAIVMLLIGAGGGQMIKPELRLPENFSQNQEDVIKSLVGAITTLQTAYVNMDVKAMALDEAMQHNRKAISRVDSANTEHAKAFGVIWKDIEKVKQQNEIIIDLLKAR